MRDKALGQRGNETEEERKKGKQCKCGKTLTFEQRVYGFLCTSTSVKHLFIFFVHFSIYIFQCCMDTHYNNSVNPYFSQYVMSLLQI